MFLVDVPGFLIGVEGELRGMPGKVINWMNAMSLVTVPQDHRHHAQELRPGLHQHGRRPEHRRDRVLADRRIWASWTRAVSVNVLYGVKEEDDPERFRQLVAEVDRDTTPWELARLYEAQYVIDPRDTRSWLMRMLDVHRMRLTRGVGRHRRIGDQLADERGRTRLRDSEIDRHASRKAEYCRAQVEHEQANKDLGARRRFRRLRIPVETGTTLLLPKHPCSRIAGTLCIHGPVRPDSAQHV